MWLSQENIKLLKDDPTSIFGLRELLQLELKVALLWEAIKVFREDPRLSLDHDALC